MANKSIFAAFERMWQHLFTTIDTKADAKHAHGWDEVGGEMIDTDILTWDGTLHGRTLGVHDFPEEYGANIVHMSYDTPTLDDFANGTTMTWANGNSQTVTVAEIMNVGNGVLLEDNFNFAVVQNDNTTLTIPAFGMNVTVTFPKKGVYLSRLGDSYLTSLQVDGYKFTVMQPTTIPNHLLEPFEMIDALQTISVDVDGFEGLQFVKITDTVLPADALDQASVTIQTNDGRSWTSMVNLESNENGVTGGYFSFSVNGGSATHTGILISTSSALNIDDETDDIVIPDKGTYVAPFGGSFPTITKISLIYGGEKLEIKQDYLPSHLQFGDQEDTLTWDGDTTGLIKGEHNLPIDTMNYYCISDETLTYDILNNSHVTVTFSDGSSFEPTNYWDIGNSDDDESLLVEIANGSFAIALVDDISGSLTMDGASVTFACPKKGIYVLVNNGVYVSSITIDGHKFNKHSVQTMDSKYLPEIPVAKLPEFLQLQSEGALTWDGDTTGKHCITSGSDTYCLVSTATPTREDMLKSVDYTVSLVQDGNTGYVTLNTQDALDVMDIDFTSKYATLYPGGIYVVYAEDGYYSFDKPGTYFLYSDTVYFSGLQINGYTGFNTKPLDVKYLPKHEHTWDDIQTKSGSGSTAAVDQIEFGTMQKASDVAPSYADFLKGGTITYYEVAGDSISGNVVNNPRITGGPYTANFPSADWTLKSSSTGVAIWYKGWPVAALSALDPKAAGVGIGTYDLPSSGLYFDQWTATGVSVVGLTLNDFDGFVHKQPIPDDYLPDDIIRVSDTLTWDGNLSNKCAVWGEEDNIRFAWVHISDAIPTLNDLVDNSEYCFHGWDSADDDYIFPNTADKFTETSDYIEGPGGYYVVIKADNVTWNDYSFPKAGIYFNYINGNDENVYKSHGKYLTINGYQGFTNLPKTGVEAGTYGGYDTTAAVYNVPNITTDEYGRVTNASNSVLDTTAFVKTGSASTIHTAFGSGYQLNANHRYICTIAESLLKYNLIYNYTTQSSDIVAPRILNVMVYVYIDADKSRQVWIPADYYAYKETDTKGNTYWFIGLGMPEEYFDYNATSGSHQAPFAYYITYESISNTAQM